MSFANMEKLGMSMRRNTTRMPKHRWRPPPPPAYTYFGQFVMHDLTRDDTPLFDCPAPDPNNVVNHRTPFLDLDALYGDGPDSKDVILYGPDRVSLRLGNPTVGEEPFDVPLDRCEKHPVLADERNNENIIIRQIHAMFLKLHNMAVEENSQRFPADEVLAKSRERVCCQYQWIVAHDFLKWVCNGFVYEDVIINGNTQIDWGHQFSIPVEFAHAAARFGHSMVRHTYDLNAANIDTPVRKIFSDAHREGALNPGLAIDWRRFTSVVSNFIDTTIVDDLYHIPPAAAKLFVERITMAEPTALAVKTLYRNVAMRIPPAQIMRQQLDPAGTLSLPCEPGYDPGSALRDLQLLNRTPLWYYILLEAEVNEGGGHLGTLGSRIIAEVIEASLRNDPNSFRHQQKCDPDWRPERWKTLQGDIAIDTLFDLAVVVGLAKKDPL